MLILLCSILACKPETTNEALLRAFKAVCWVESKGDPNAVNRDEHAIGIAQIRPIMLADANRIIGYQKWDTMSCYDPVQSWEIFRLVVKYYHPKGGPEQWSRLWNAGPNWRAKLSKTDGYWKKVRAAMK